MTTPESFSEAEFTEGAQTTSNPEAVFSEAPTSEAPSIPSNTTTVQPMEGEHFSGGIVVVGGFEAGVEETDMCYWEGDLWICMPSPQSIIIESEIFP